jgi:hypothetical protein
VAATGSLPHWQRRSRMASAWTVPNTVRNQAQSRDCYGWKIRPVNAGRKLPKCAEAKFPTSLLDRSELGGTATALGAAKGRALARPPQAVASLDRSCAPWPLQPVGTKGAPTIRRRLRRVEPRASLRRCARTAFGWPSAPTRRIGDRIGNGLRAHGFRDEVGVLAQTVAGAFDMHDDGMVQKSVEQRSRDHRISKNLAPFGKAAI